MASPKNLVLFLGILLFLVSLISPQVVAQTTESEIDDKRGDQRFRPFPRPIPRPKPKLPCKIECCPGYNFVRGCKKYCCTTA